MAQLVVAGATLKCSNAQPSPGTATLQLVPNMVTGKSQTVATIQDYQLSNIATFGMCQAPTNSKVIAAQGSPAPCTPVIVAPWVSGSPTVTVGGQPALTSDSICTCTDGFGLIEVKDPRQTEISTG
jgi:hypothetical protein